MAILAVPPAAARTATSITVFAPSSSVTVTVEPDGTAGDDIHFHAGGQGVWVARTILRLGEQPRLCTTSGGEAGRVLEALVAHDGIGLCPVRVQRVTGTYVHDRRGGDREVVAENAPGRLRRHELDDLYETVLADALATGLVVITGRRRVEDVGDGFYRRLGSDLAMSGVTAIGDLHGTELSAFLDTGRLHLLKVSSEDLAVDGIQVDDDDDEDGFVAIDRLRRRGVTNVVLTRGRAAALAVIDDSRFVAKAVPISSADHRGSGDAMTGAMAVGVRRRLDPASLLSLGCGAGAASATRHGLATADVRLIAELADRCEVECLGPAVSTRRATGTDATG